MKFNPKRLPTLTTTLYVTWGTSRGADTYGYTTCSLRDRSGKKYASTCGGGYDMFGTVLAHAAGRVELTLAGALYVAGLDKAEPNWRDRAKEFWPSPPETKTVTVYWVTDFEDWNMETTFHATEAEMHRAVVVAAVSKGRQRDWQDEAA